MSISKCRDEIDGRRKMKYDTFMKLFSVCAAVAVVGAAWSEPVEFVWVGGSSGNASEEDNWEPKGLPSSTEVPYVISFTNTATVLNGFNSWCLAGVKVRNGAKVSISGVEGKNRLYVSACETFVIDVDEGCSLSHVRGDGDDCAFYGNSKPVVKTGAGEFVPGSRMGWSAQTSGPIGSLEVREGTLNCLNSTIRAIGEIKVCSGATLISQSINVNKGYEIMPYLNIARGGTFDGGGFSHALQGLEGEGAVTNVDTLTLQMVYTGKRFSGRIYASELVVSNSDYTTSGAWMTIGSADTLKGVQSWEISNDETVPMELRFAPGIGVFGVGPAYPKDRLFYDEDGMPVIFMYSHAEWYVDDDNFGKSGNGKTPATAFGTLQEAMENPSLAEYDTVYVLPGDYDKGGVTYGGESFTTNRVVVPDKVRLMATGSAAETVIFGSRSTDISKDGLGNGPGAVRCVLLLGESSVHGFTLTGGAVSSTVDEDIGVDQDKYGGAVWCKNSDPLIVNCIVSNNVALRAGAVRNGTSVRSVFTRNRATSNLGSVWYGTCDLYGCVENDNPCSSKYAYYSTSVNVTILNCTFGPDAQYNFRVTKNSALIRNSVFLGGVHTAPAGCYEKCVFACNLQGGELVGADSACVIITNLSTSAERLAFAGLDANLKPVRGGLVVDRGINSHFRNEQGSVNCRFAELDVSGGQRFSNGVIDIGAYEYDWSADFGKMLLGDQRDMPVIYASADVTANSSGGVSLADGCVMKAECVRNRGYYSASVRVTGSGILRITVAENGEYVVTGSDGMVPVRFHVAEVPTGVRFAFSGEGTAEISSFTCPEIGFRFMLR